MHTALLDRPGKAPAGIAVLIATAIFGLALGGLIPLAHGGELREALGVWGGLFLLVAAFLPLESLLKAVLYWILFEALARRYIANDIAIFFLKDSTILLIYAKYISKCVRDGKSILPPAGWLLPMAALLVWSLGNFLFTFRDLEIGLLGLRSSFFYVPLVFLAKEAFNDTRGLLRFLAVYALVGIPVCLFGLIQQFAGPESILNVNYLDYGTAFTIDGQRVAFRSASTFASNGAFSEYIFFILILGLVLFLLPSRQIPRLLEWAILASVAAAIAATAQGALLFFVFLLVPWCLMQSGAKRHRNSFLTAAAAVCLVLWAIPDSHTRGLERAYNNITPDSLAERFNDHILAALPASWEEAVFGHGIGTNAKGLRYLVGAHQLDMYAGVEGGYARFSWELGLIGLLLGLWTQAALLAAAWRIRSRLRDPSLQVVAFGLLMLQVSCAIWMLVSQKWDSSTFAILYWFFTGFLFLLPRLDIAAMKRLKWQAA